jgi:transcriptional regulator
MHPASIYTVTDESRLLAHLSAHPFATIAAAPDGLPRVAHTPVIARRTETGLVLDFHVSRVNALAGFLEAGFPALAVSLGAEAYVSPDWYESADQVPSWNYAAVEAQGPVSALDGAGLVALLDDLSILEEGRLAPKPPWTRGKMSPGRFEAMLRGIVGARMTVERLEGTAKLSQNKSAADQAGVIEALGRESPIGWRMVKLSGL